MESREMLAADFFASPGGDFGQPGGPIGRVSGNVFAVQSNSCGPHDNATGLAGVRILLTDNSGNVVLETVTDEHGSYDFSDLLPGTYAITQIPPLGFLGTQSHVGGGGGLSLNANQVDNVNVAAGLESQGYDFCDFDIQSFKEGIQVAAQIAAQSLGNSNLPANLEPTVVASTEFVFNHSSPTTDLAPVSVAPTTTFVSSPNQSPATRSAVIEEWDHAPLEDAFSVSEFLELASSTNSITDHLELQTEDLEVYEESRDALFADGYTVKSLEWWDEESSVKLDQLMGDTEIIQLEEEPTAAATETGTPTKIAHRRETRYSKTQRTE